MNRDIIKIIYFWSPISTFFDEQKLKNKYFSDKAGFLGYKVNTCISFLAEKVAYYQICGTKVGQS